MINCFIIEDEPLAQAKLAKYISGVPFLHCVGSAGNPLEITWEFAELGVQLVFSDILMPGMQGIEYLRTLRHAHPSHPLPGFIFISADPNFALESYELNVIDYFVKPYTFERFYQACLKAARTIRPDTPEAMPAADGYISVKVAYRYRMVYHRDIIYIEGARDYVNIVTTTGSYLHHCTLKQLIEHELPGDRFIQTERSYIINTDYIEDVGAQNITMAQVNERIKLGEAYRDAVYRHLNLPIKAKKGRR